MNKERKGKASCSSVAVVVENEKEKGEDVVRVITEILIWSS